MSKNTGGPAFPMLDYSRHDERDGTINHFSAQGMTLRDYFAAEALGGLLACSWPMSALGYEMKDGKSVMENNAICAYELADAMLAARGAA